MTLHDYGIFAGLTAFGLFFAIVLRFYVAAIVEARRARPAHATRITFREAYRMLRVYKAYNVADAILYAIWLKGWSKAIDGLVSRRLNAGVIARVR